MTHLAARRFFNSVKPITVATLLACATMSAQAADGVVIIGDSLSDGGYYAAVGGQRFTTNPGKTAAEYIAEGLGFTTTPSNQGGTNYAQGGAKVNSNSLSTPAGFAQRPISTQVTEVLTANAGKDLSNTAFLIQGGANDAFQNMTMYSSGYISQAQLTALTQQSVVDFVTQVAKLSKLTGSQQIIVQNLPNLGATPAFQSLGAAAAAGATQLAQGFNAGVSQGLNQLGLSVVLLDNYTMLSEVVANPSAYGFTNATGVACTVSSSLFCSGNTLVTPNAASSYVFADGVHPTTAAQKLSAQYALSVLKAPSQIGTVGAAAISAGSRYAQRLMIYAPNAGDQTWHVFADAGYSKTDFGQADSKNKYLLVGADRRISGGNVHAGVTLGYDRASGDLDTAAGEFNLKETSVGAYVAKKADQGEILGYARYGWLNADINRNIALGTANRKESGSTQGAHYTIGVQGHLVLGTFAEGKVKHGPVGGFAYEHLLLNGYDEVGSTSTSMNFGAQKREGFVANVGYQLRGDFGKIKPYASLSYEVDGTDADKIKARLKSAPTSFSAIAPKTDNGLRLKLGTHIDLAKNVNLAVGAERTFGKDAGQETAVNIGLDARF